MKISINLIVFLFSLCCFGQLDKRYVQTKYFKKSIPDTVHENNIKYYVEENLQTVAAIKAGSILWRKNVVLECEKVKQSDSKIYRLTMHKGYLHAFYKNGEIWIDPDGSIFLCGI